MSSKRTNGLLVTSLAALALRHGDGRDRPRARRVGAQGRPRAGAVRLLRPGLLAAAPAGAAARDARTGASARPERAARGGGAAGRRLRLRRARGGRAAREPLLPDPKRSPRPERHLPRHARLRARRHQPLLVELVISTTQTVKVELEVEKGPCGDEGPSKAIFTFTFKKGRLASNRPDRSAWQPIPPA